MRVVYHYSSRCRRRVSTLNYDLKMHCNCNIKWASRCTMFGTFSPFPEHNMYSVCEINFPLHSPHQSHFGRNSDSKVCRRSAYFPFGMAKTMFSHEIAICGLFERELTSPLGKRAGDNKNDG